MAPATSAPIQTARLLLLPPSPALARAVAAYQRENAAHLAPWSPAAPADFLDEGFWAARLADQAAEQDAGRAVRLVLVEPSGPEEVIGLVGFTTIVRGVWHCANLGYQIAARHEGRGLMAEAVEAGVRHMFDDRGLHRIQANYMPRNERSARLLRKLGFRVEGYAYDYLMIAGRWEDHVLTSRTNPAWRPPA